MSAIIGICGNNFCSFAADGRLSKLDENFQFAGVIKDDFKKIKKLNDRLIYGAAGFLGRKDGLLDPFKNLYTRKTLTMAAAKQMVTEYMVNNSSRSPLRTALLGGKDEVGHFCIYTFKMTVGQTEPDVTLYKPEPPEKNFAMAYAIPHRCLEVASAATAEYFDMSRMTSHSDLLSRMDYFIHCLAQVDQSIGGRSCMETVL